MAATTISSCTTQMLRGAHRFKIRQYSYGNVGTDVNADGFIRSSTFRVGGFDWAILYYPHGYGDDSEGFISVFVEFMSKYDGATALVDLRLINQVTGEPKSWCSFFREDEDPIRFKSDSFEEATWGKERFIRREALEDSVYVRDNCLVIECVITVLGELRVSETKALCEVHVPPPNALQHFGKMLEDTSTTDVTFKVEQETFAAHRAVLAARSSVFQKQLSEPMKKKSHITINRMEPTVFKALLHFIYTDSLPKMDDLDRDENNAVLQSLLAAADQYDLERLKLMCARILCTDLDVENVAGVLWLADKYNCQKLKEACVDFMDSSNRIDAVVASQGYQLLKRSSPCPLTDAWEKRSRARISFR
ncbi:BTB/POZ and MATH domain-containing protein 1-like [Lolium rigidum]|uniref:BTB/POZ and MATH domain-containing protein 1-like n=1 Tax=Lolium rigidum TaxID=89674 RepID=UPI001F5D8BE9|nr:BTB/POZ and MATH domain-containing protein 1-like [Lolium rigidum]